MKETEMPPVHAANLVANIGITAYGVKAIDLLPKMYQSHVPQCIIL